LLSLLVVVGLAGLFWIFLALALGAGAGAAFYVLLYLTALLALL
jgi:hypothetical protein